MSSEKKYVLVVEWFDPAASLIKQFYFTYFLPSKHIEMFDIRNHKMFLKKISYPDISVEDLYLGNVLVVFNRQLKIVDFGDEFTRKALVGTSESNKTYGMLKPDSYLNFGKLISAAYQNFVISNLKMFQFSKELASQFYAEHEEKEFFPRLMEFIISDFVVGLELIANDAVSNWRKLIGPTDSIKAKKEAPNTLRALFGTDGTKNACHGSDSAASAYRYLSLIFSGNSLAKSQPYCSNCTLCIIKPHVVKNKQVGKVIDAILGAGFEISAMQMIWFDMAVATEFYYAYSFLPEAKRMIDHLASGASVVLEVRQYNAVESFRNLCGPYDPYIARKLYKDSLRSQFGIDRVQNGVHCTDLAYDGQLEIQFVFNTLLT